jgi:hypothetical protein
VASATHANRQVHPHEAAGWPCSTPDSLHACWHQGPKSKLFNKISLTRDGAMVGISDGAVVGDMVGALVGTVVGPAV